ncbi:MAG TPA: protease modulator HflC [Hyphomonadaceae bacterium]|jgi:membrane protease subunit HflC|nr:protease modulator HflC [Hyphomonadaceae bacterium]HPN04837.1 protease modulator HflC [Hyphomonadaceae bacterium]
MQRLLIIGGVIAAGVLIILANAFYIVALDQQAIVLRFGQYQYAVNADGATRGAGLHFKVPVVENVIYYDKRNMGFDLDSAEITAADQQRLNVDAIARWRIKDPTQFFRAATSMENGLAQLRQRFNAALRGELGKVSQPDIISGQRASVMQRIKTALQAQMTTLGIEIIDVRIRQADLPEANSQRVYERMKSQLQQKVNQYRAEGEGLYLSIVGEADKQVEVILAEANQKSQVLRGEGDAERNKIYAAAYGKDPEFFSFYRSLEAYDKSIKTGTPFVMSPDSDFFKYFKSSTSR